MSNLCEMECNLLSIIPITVWCRYMLYTHANVKPKCQFMICSGQWIQRPINTFSNTRWCNCVVYWLSGTTQSMGHLLHCSRTPPWLTGLIHNALMCDVNKSTWSGLGAKWHITSNIYQFWHLHRMLTSKFYLDYTYLQTGS